MNDLTLYECDDIIHQIELKAMDNEGELSEEDLQAIVEAQTTSIEKLSKLVNYIHHLTRFSDSCKSEIQRIQERKKVADNRLSSIKDYLLPWAEKNGPKDIGTTRISTRKSKGVVLVDGFDNPQYCEEVITLKPDKKKIKEDIENGIEVKGAVLEQRLNLSIK